jgi:hypothetical protein
MFKEEDSKQTTKLTSTLPGDRYVDSDFQCRDVALNRSDRRPPTCWLSGISPKKEYAVSRPVFDRFR